MVSEASILGLSVEDGVEDSDWPDGHEAEAEVCNEEIVWFDKHVFVTPIWLVFILYTNDAIFACQDNGLNVFVWAPFETSRRGDVW